MGTSEDGDGGGNDVGGVGTIVWVRRRNGSWWPGRILGSEELSASHLMSPRSGTPVKLLGREDASVDWYNLEKSKRVKPFRCGEFDSCIQRAEASQGGPVKKREKYARREDAILHALELERKQSEMKQHISGVHVDRITNKPLGLKRGSNFSTSDILVKNKDSGVHGKYALCKLRKGASLHEENTSNSVYVSNEKTSKPIKLDKDISETMPHMKELQDCDSRISPKKKLLFSAVSETSGDSTPNNMEKYPIMGVADYISSRSSAIKVKRKSSGATAEESPSKKLVHQHPPVVDLQRSVELQSSYAFQPNHGSHIMRVQEEQDDTGVAYRGKRCRDIYLPADLSDSMHDVGYSFKERHTLPTLSEMERYFNKPNSLTKENVSRMIEAYESDSSQTECLVSNMEDADLLDDTGGSTLLGTRNCESVILQNPDKINVNSSQMPFGSSILQGHLHERPEPISAELGVFRWHIKGKRNNRNLLRRPSDLADDEVFMSSYKCNGSLKGTTLKRKVKSLKMGEMEPSSPRNLGRGSDHYRKDMDYTMNKFDLVGDISDEDELIGYDKQKYPLVLDSLIDDRKSHMIYEDLENDTYESLISGWEPSGGCMAVPMPRWRDNNVDISSSYPSKRMGSTLIDVDVEVQRGYQGERVPLVSLMSRLNGKAIIGHPIQVEILEDGSVDQYFPSVCPVLDESKSTYPVRRTSMSSVPHSNSMASSLEGGEDAGAFEFPDWDNKPAIKKYSGHFSYQARLAKKSYHHARQHPQDKYPKSSKGVKFSSQRSRTPCSNTTKHKYGKKNHDSKLTSSHGILGGLIGADGIMPPVTCVPVKVVFSRILEAVGRPSSIRAHHLQMASHALKHLS